VFPPPWTDFSNVAGEKLIKREYPVVSKFDCEAYKNVAAIQAPEMMNHARFASTASLY
jgi:hypothetical protein